MLVCPTSSVTTPAISSAAPTTARTAIRERVVSPVKPITGSARRRSVACSPAGAFLEMSTIADDAEHEGPGERADPSCSHQRHEDEDRRDQRREPGGKRDPGPVAQRTGCRCSRLPQSPGPGATPPDSTRSRSRRRRPRRRRRCARSLTSTPVRAEIPAATPPRRRCSGTRRQEPRRQRRLVRICSAMQP